MTAPADSPAPGLRSRHITGTVLNADDFLDDRPEVLAVRGAEGSGDILPNEVSRSNKVSWYVSLFEWLFSIPFVIRVCSMNRPERAPAKPALAPATLRSWHGLPPADNIHRSQCRAIQLVMSPTWSISWGIGFSLLHGERLRFHSPSRQCRCGQRQSGSLRFHRRGSPSSSSDHTQCQ